MGYGGEEEESLEQIRPQLIWAGEDCVTLLWQEDVLQPAHTTSQGCYTRSSLILREARAGNKANIDLVQV